MWKKQAINNLENNASLREMENASKTNSLPQSMQRLNKNQYSNFLLR